MRFLTAFLAFFGVFLNADTRIEFHSQAHQDEFVYTILYGLQGKKGPGCYLEIGAGEPVFINNTYFFEKSCGWQGVSVDILDYLMPRWDALRSNPLLIEDAIQLDYVSVLNPFPQVIDYLSLDVDGYYDAVLRQVMQSNKLFKVITIEHDAYRYGDVYRTKEREILRELGYYLLCADVCHNSCTFEDWWVWPGFFEHSVFDKLTSLDLNGKDCGEIMRKIRSVQRFF